MEDGKFIGQNYALVNLLKYAEVVKTPEGNEFYRFNCWFQLHTGDFEFTVYHGKIPEDLHKFICKAGLGQPNPQIEKPKL